MEEHDLKTLGTLAIGVVMLSIIVVVGIIVLDKFNYQLRLVTSANVKDITLSTSNVGVLVGSSGTYPYLQTATNCVNASNSAIMFNTSYYTVQEGSSSGGYILLRNITSGSPVNSSYWENSNINCTITYRASTTESNSTAAFSTGLVTFATFLGLIILAAIGKIIITMFRKGL